MDECPNCEYHRKRAQRWRDEAYKQAGHPLPEREPVAWGVFEGNLHDMFFSQEEAQEMADLKGTHAEVRPLYTTPPQRTWIELTDDERQRIRTAVLKEKNNG
jgi:hypothetical protein